MSGQGDNDSFLDQLEHRVHAAVKEIQSLRKENRKLASRIEELDADGSPDSNDWAEERRDIRDRVERLTERLESLLEDD